MIDKSLLYYVNWYTLSMLLDESVKHVEDLINIGELKLFVLLS